MIRRQPSTGTAVGRWAASSAVGVLCAVGMLGVLGLLSVSQVQAQSVAALPSADSALPAGPKQKLNPNEDAGPEAEAEGRAFPERMARERQALAAQKAAILQAEAAQQVLCWQKFAVNACLTAARRARRQDLEPLRQQELALNAQERLWRTEQREQRLQGKQSGLERTP